MSEIERSRERAIFLKEQYPVGTRLMLKNMDDVQAPPFGTLGTLMGVDANGNILVQWDTGSALSVTEVNEIVIIERG